VSNNISNPVFTLSLRSKKYIHEIAMIGQFSEAISRTSLKTNKKEVSNSNQK
jgi:hypothetical protein